MSQFQPLLAAPLCLLAGTPYVLGATGAPAVVATRQEGVAATGTLRGQILDRDFEAPLADAQVLLVETGQRVQTNDSGNYSLSEVPAGRYTVVVAKEGYVRQVRTEVAIVGGQLTDLNLALSGDYTDMEEFVVQDIVSAPAGTESALLQLRVEAPALMDSVGAELMSKAGASDAASALRLVSGATVQDGKFAVVRGLPDRYVSSQLNGVRMPSADEDKRAVELDQFPAVVIESIQVSKTFTPDQQGDASGGAVNIVLKSIPDETVVSFKGQVGFNSQVKGSDFITYDGGGVGTWGRDDGGRDIQYDLLGQSWDGASGATSGEEPFDSKWSIAGGGKLELSKDVKFGGLLSFFYERDSSYQTGFEDELWRKSPGAPMTPAQGQVQGDTDFKTSLFDITQASQSVQWGGLATTGIETENHRIGLTFLYTHTAEDTTTVATDTRGKRFFFGEDYDPYDTSHPGNQPDALATAPYIRTDTLEYNERTTGTLQLTGKHSLVDQKGWFGGPWEWGVPEVDWTVSSSFADMDQPDKRQFGAQWTPEVELIPGLTIPSTWTPYKPAANFNLGNFQRIWKTIEEDSVQLSTNLRVPFKTTSDDRGYVKTGIFADRVDRQFTQESFSNFGDGGATYAAPWEEPWSAVFSEEDHPISASDYDVDYRGAIDISAWYAMVDYPFNAEWKAVGGARVEQTSIEVINEPEGLALWYPNGTTAPVVLNPGDADVDIDQTDVLPSLGVEWQASKQWTFRGAVSGTLARQTFKELTPILQQEYLGGPIFIGNPELDTSSLVNFDLRADWTPRESTFVSASIFHKEVQDAIEYVQRVGDFTYTTPVNYPKGHLTGLELEARQKLGDMWKSMESFSIGGNATFIASEVTLPDDEAALFEQPNIQAPMPTRDMTNAPEHLYNLYLTWDDEDLGTQVALFWTVQGDTLVAGAAEDDGNFVPNIYAKEYDTLNLSLSQQMGILRWQLQVKNITNPEVQEVYRSKYIGPDVPKSSYTKGIEYSLGFSLSF